MRKSLYVVCIALFSMICLFFLGVQHAASQSSNVVIIGGTTLSTTGSPSSAANVMGCTYGGWLAVTGPAGELGDFTFTAMAPSAVSDASLAPYDTAVLNVASQAMNCDTSTLTAGQKTALIDFVASGRKLIIYDSECWPGPVDYSWLPYPFTTANPGAMGAPGTLTIVEDNTLSSSDASDVHYIDAADLSTNTDAVGDMNVMTTYDPYWCIDMSGTNYINVSGPVHTYAKYPEGTDTGLIIYNGLDMDYMSYNNNLRKIWVQELQQPFNPSGLPCGKTVVGITLNPLYESNNVGDSHTVTATLSDLLGILQEGIEVSFEVVSGPNAGAAGTCNPSDCVSDEYGEVSFTYTGVGGVGVDEIEACFIDEDNAEICSQIVLKEWIQTNAPPVAQCKNVTESADENCEADASIDDGSGDPDGDPVTITESPGGPYPLGSTLVTLTITDGEFTDLCYGTVTVVDDTPPEISCPDDKTIECDESTDPKNTDEATATDNCDGDPDVAYTDTVTPGACPQAKTITRTWIATDDSGNTSSCVQTITVQDTTPPVVNCNAPSTITPPDAPISFTATATDNCELLSVEITDYDCWWIDKKGKLKSKLESCVVEVDGATITILDSGGVGDNITWTVVATDSCGNITETTCEIVVVNPAK